MAYQKEDGAYTVDFSLFNVTYAVPTPKCSAKDLARLTELNANIAMTITEAGESGEGEDEDEIDEEGGLQGRRGTSSTLSSLTSEDHPPRPSTPSIMRWHEFGDTVGGAFLTPIDRKHSGKSEHVHHVA